MECLVETNEGQSPSLRFPFAPKGRDIKLNILNIFKEPTNQAT